MEKTLLKSFPAPLYKAGKVGISLLFFLFASIAFAQDTGAIKVTIEGIKGDEGVARIALVKDKASFTSDSAEPFMGAAEKITDGRAEHIFRNVPFGDYAVKFFHDKDNSGSLKTGAFGIPKEDYGFSNNISGKNFEKAKFKLDRPEIVIDIKAK